MSGKKPTTQRVEISVNGELVVLSRRDALEVEQLAGRSLTQLFAESAGMEGIFAVQYVAAKKAARKAAEKVGEESFSFMTYEEFLDEDFDVDVTEEDEGPNPT